MQFQDDRLKNRRDPPVGMTRVARLRGGTCRDATRGTHDAVAKVRVEVARRQHVPAAAIPAGFLPRVARTKNLAVVAEAILLGGGKRDAQAALRLL